MAVEETVYGNAPTSSRRICGCGLLPPRTIRGMKTFGVSREIPERKWSENLPPMESLRPSFSDHQYPTSTAIYKVNRALKSGNAIFRILRIPALSLLFEIVAVINRSAIRAGSPEGVIQCITEPTLEATTPD